MAGVEADLGRLAIDGGTPVRTEPFGPTWDLGDEEIDGLTEVIRTGVLVSRRLSWVERLEAELAAMFGVKHVLACTSGTAACHLAVAMLDLEPLDELISAPIGDVATTAGAVLQNLIPVFVDVDPETLTLDPNRVEDAITDRTRALLPVHFVGQPADMAAVLEIARRRDLRVIEDCCQAMLSEWDGRLVGTLGDVGAFSLSNKLIVMGQGGFVATNDDQLAARGRLFRDVARRGLAPALWIGTAYLMTDLQAAVGLAQLRKARGYMERQVAAADWLRTALADLSGIHVLGDDPRSRPNRLFLPIALVGDAPLTDRFARALVAEGVPAIFPYDEPIYRHPLYAEWHTYGRSGYPFSARASGPIDYRRVHCSVVEDALSRTMFVRMNQSFTNADLDDIAAAFHKVAAALGLDRRTSADPTTEGEGS